MAVSLIGVYSGVSGLGHHTAAVRSSYMERLRDGSFPGLSQGENLMGYNMQERSPEYVSVSGYNVQESSPEYVSVSGLDGIGSTTGLLVLTAVAAAAAGYCYWRMRKTGVPLLPGKSFGDLGYRGEYRGRRHPGGMYPRGWLFR